MKFDFDKMFVGTLLGIISPVLVFLGYYQINHPYMTVHGLINYLVLAGIYTQLTTLCVLANLGVFFIFIQKQKYQAARGVLLATFIYAGLVVYFKFFT